MLSWDSVSAKDFTFYTENIISAPVSPLLYLWSGLARAPSPAPSWPCSPGWPSLTWNTATFNISSHWGNFSPPPRLTFQDNFQYSARSCNEYNSKVSHDVQFTIFTYHQLANTIIVVSKDSYLPVNNELAKKHPNFRWSDDRVLMPIYVMPMVSEYWILCSTFDTFIIYLSSSKWQSLSAVLTLSSKELCSSLSPSVSVSPMSRLPAESASWPFLDNRKMFTTCPDLDMTIVKLLQTWWA